MMSLRTIDPENTVTPRPWRFHARLWGFSNVIADRDRRYIVSNVRADCGPLLAAGPTLLAALETIATLTAPGSPVHELALGTVESYREREGMALVDWKPNTPAPRLRIVGVAS